MNAGRTYLDYLHDIHEAATKAITFARGLSVDAAVVWQTVQDDLPDLLHALDRVLRAEEPGGSPQ